MQNIISEITFDDIVQNFEFSIISKTDTLVLIILYLNNKLEKYAVSLSKKLFSLMIILSAFFVINTNAADHLVFDGGDGPGKGKHVVFIAGDEEYRSEEAMPLMAQILNKQGFKCTVLFSIDEKTGFVSPNNQKSVTNPAAMDSADAIVMSIRSETGMMQP